MEGDRLLSGIRTPAMIEIGFAFVENKRGAPKQQTKTHTHTQRGAFFCGSCVVMSSGAKREGQRSDQVDRFGPVPSRLCKEMRVRQNVGEVSFGQQWRKQKKKCPLHPIPTCLGYHVDPLLKKEVSTLKNRVF